MILCLQVIRGNLLKEWNKITKRIKYFLPIPSIPVYAIVFIFTLLTSHNIIHASIPQNSISAMPVEWISSYDIDGVPVKQIEYTFEDESNFVIKRFNFSESTINPKNNIFTDSVHLNGSTIIIRYQNYEGDSQKWVETSDYLNNPFATLFIETGTEGLIISVPALYKNKFEYNTIDAIKDKELPIEIFKTVDGFEIIAKFQYNNQYVGEYWYLKTKGNLMNWSESDRLNWLNKDLHKTSRFCMDGYYYKTYTNYTPYTPNGYFRNPANYVGSHLLTLYNKEPAYNIGYAMCKICLNNQNSDGYWETGPMSEWLNKDYGVGYNFYDTRFNTDFAYRLVKGYKKYNTEDFLNGAVKYAEFLINFTEEHGYIVNKSGNDSGLLTPDYWCNVQTEKTHVSLNHQLSEINFLYELYIDTNNIKYLNYGNKMLQGIINTYDYWPLPNGDLKYAIYNNENKTKLIDYIYLTYNDLYDTKQLLDTLGQESREIVYLMNVKKTWLESNGHFDYKK